MPLDSPATLPRFVNPQPSSTRLPPVTHLLAMSDAGQNNPLLTSADPLGSRLDSSYNPVYDGFIDLTNESSPPRPLQLSESSFSDPDIEDESISFLQEESPRATDLETMPRLQTPLQQEPSRKRRRLNSERASQSRRISSHLQDQRHTASGNFITLDSHTNEDHEEVLDLTAVDGIEALSKAQQQQKERHFALQEQQNQLVRDSVQSQISENKGPFKLGQLQCVICMDNMTDMTATHCGHLFCHTCIMEALIAGENQAPDGRGLSRCPSCRTKVVRNHKIGAAPQIIPLALKFTKKSEKARGKERAVS